MNGKHGKRGLWMFSLLSAVAAVVALMVGGPASGARAPAAAPAGTYVGTLAGSHAFVAVLLGEGGALRAYVYDATHRIAAWSEPAPAGIRLTAAAAAARIDLSSTQGARLDATITRNSLSGSVSLGSGQQHTFDAVRVAPPGRFHEILVGTGASQYLGGWIIWAPGHTLGYLDPAPVVLMLARQPAS